MQLPAASVLLLGLAALLDLMLPGVESAKDKKLQIGIKKRVDPEKCKMKSRKGDVLSMHYTVGSQILG